MTRIAILDYGMGNLRSVEKALERVGAEAEVTADPRPGRGRRRRDPAGGGRVPEGDERVRELGLDELVAERHRGRGPGARDLPRPAASLRVVGREQGAPVGSACSPGVVAPARGQGLQGAAHRLAAGALGALLAAHRGIWATETPFYFVHSFAPVRPPATTCSARPPTASASPARSSARPLYGVQFHPEKSSSAGLAPAGQLRRVCSLVRLILYPGDRHPRRQGGPADAGRLRPRDRLRRRPGGRRPALGGRGSPLAARRRSRWRARGRAREPRARAADRRRGRCRRSSSAEACATRRRSRRRSPRARARGPRHGRRPRPRDGRRRSRRARRADRGLGRCPLGHGRGGGMDGAPRTSGTAEVITALSRARRAPLRLHAGRGRRTDGGAGPRFPARRPPRGHRRRADLLGRDRHARRPALPRRSWGSRTSAE